MVICLQHGNIIPLQIRLAHATDASRMLLILSTCFSATVVWQPALTTIIVELRVSLQQVVHFPKHLPCLYTSLPRLQHDADLRSQHSRTSWALQMCFQISLRCGAFLCRDRTAAKQPCKVVYLISLLACFVCDMARSRFGSLGHMYTVSSLRASTARSRCCAASKFRAKKHSYG